MSESSEPRLPVFVTTTQVPDAVEPLIDRRHKNSIDIAVSKERRRRVDHWRSMSPEELAQLPEIASEVVDVHGHRVMFTTLRQVHGERLLIVLRTARPVFLGAAMQVANDGFWVLPGGEVVEISSQQIQKLLC